LAFYLVIVVAVIGYIALNNNRKKKAALVQKKAIEPGVHVMTTFGLYGTVRGVDDDSVLLEIDDNVLVRINKRAVGTTVPDPSDTLDTSELDDDHDDHDGHDGHDGHDHDHDEPLTDELADVGSDDLDVADAPDAEHQIDLTAGAAKDATPPAKDAETKATSDSAGPSAATGHDDGPGPVPTR
jgi:preprotein translocase subunit YajC